MKAKAADQNQNERPSVLGRLKEKQELLSKAEKKEVSAPEKKPERDMQ
jgi:ppGpp synthetase/RelA/SpoT-type nucleotidyltranferase